MVWRSGALRPRAVVQGFDFLALFGMLFRSRVSASVTEVPFLSLFKSAYALKISKFVTFLDDSSDTSQELASRSHRESTDMTSLLKKHRATLDVRPNATRKDIKEAHRQIFMKFHPDRQVRGRRHSLDDASVAELLSKATLARDQLLEWELKHEQIGKKRKLRREEGERKKTQAVWQCFVKT